VAKRSIKSCIRYIARHSKHTKIGAMGVAPILIANKKAPLLLKHTGLYDV